MAFWVLGAGAGPPDSSNEDQSWQQTHDNHHHHRHHQHSYQYPDDYRRSTPQSPFISNHPQSHHHGGYGHAPSQPTGPDGGAGRRTTQSIQIKNLAFLVIREAHPDDPQPETCSSSDGHAGMPTAAANGSFSHRPPPQRPAAVERTESGLAISDPVAHNHDTGMDDDEEHGGPFLDDLAAAQLVRDHVASFHRRCPDSQHARILRALINPKRDVRHPRRHSPSTSSSSSRSRSRRRDGSPRTASSRNSGSSTDSGADSSAFPLDDDALRSVFSAANELFFANRLARRVAWDWSHPGSAQYRSAVVGTTALRRCADLGGWETLIVLSSPVLRDTRYNRRLLLSTFLHEMIHSFLFVTCGKKAGRAGGHTEGFRQIAEVIDKWVGKDYLRLSDMEADLRYFEDGTPVPATPCMGYRQMVHEQKQQQQLGGMGQEPQPMPFVQLRDGGAPMPWQADNDRSWPNHTSNDGGPAGHGMYLDEPMFPPPPQYRHPDDGAWQWYEREGFEARDGPLVGTPY